MVEEFSADLRFTNEWPWQWRPGDVEDFSAELRNRRPGGALSTIRGYQSHLRLFCEYAAESSTNNSSPSSSAGYQL